APCWPENAAAAGRRQQELQDKERTTSSHSTSTSVRAGPTRCSGAGRPRQRRRRVYLAPATTSSPPVEKQLLRANVAPDRGTIGREQRPGHGVGELHEGPGRSGRRCRGRRPSRARRPAPGLRSPGKATPAASGANPPPPTFAHLLGTCRGKNGELLSPTLAVFGHVHCCCNGNTVKPGALPSRSESEAWRGGANSSTAEEWHQQQPHYSQRYTEFARPRRNLDQQSTAAAAAAAGSPNANAPGGDAAVRNPSPAASPAAAAALAETADSRMRPKIEIDSATGQTSRASAFSAGGGGGGGRDSGSNSGERIRIGSAAAAAAAAAASLAPASSSGSSSSSSRAEGGSYHRSRKAYIQNRGGISSGRESSASPHAAAANTGAVAAAAARIGDDGVPRPVGSRHVRRFSSAGEFSNGTIGGANAAGLDRYGGDVARDNNRRRSAGSAGGGGGGGGVSGGGGGGGAARVQIRGGGIAITSLLSSEDNDTSSSSNNNNNNGSIAGGLVRRGGSHDGGANTASTTERGGSSSAPPSVFNSYQRQDSASSSVGGGAGGDFTYTPLGGGGPPSSRASTPGGGEGGRPPLVRKRSLTVAMDADPGGPAMCPSPRGRRRSVEGVFDTKDSSTSGGGSNPDGTTTRLLESPSRPPRLMAVGNNGVAVVGGGGGGGVGACFSPLVSYPSSHGDRASGGREYPLRSQAHDKLSVTLRSSSAGVGPETAAAAAAGGVSKNPMDVEWIPNENAQAGGVLPTPSPVTSVASASSAMVQPSANANAMGRPPSPFPPSPGREYRRAGGVLSRGSTHSPSPRRAPPSPAHAPGSAGMRRRGTRRLSGGRSAPRGVRSRPGVSKGVYVGAGGGVVGGEGFGSGGGGSGGGGGGGGAGSGTYESDYDSDLSEMSAYSNYSAMGSLERQLQQDTFFELDESLWRVVTRREICKAEQCVYRNPQTMVSHRKHYHATCSHVHQVRGANAFIN
ncbi:unnamed protein product, partial [Ectocarpus sp. 8 AP-2014]